MDSNVFGVPAELFSGFFGLLIAILAGVYFLPAIVASHRRSSRMFLISIGNLLFGWTVIGWVALLWISMSRFARPQERSGI